VIDTHAHLDECADRPSAVVARARAAGVERILTVGTTLERCRTAVAIAEREEGVYAVLGIHPHEAATSVNLRELAALFASERAVAVGEIGLDYFRDYAPQDAQRRLFERQLELAAELDKAVVVHTRAAEEDTLAVLAGFDGTVVLHCFSSPALLEPALERGWYVSFAGNATYKNATDLRLAATQVPADRILAETDCPYLAPQPVRGKRNEPAYVTHVYAELARVLELDVGDVARQIVANAEAVFDL
jgi:TatD DNase family protein